MRARLAEISAYGHCQICYGSPGKRRHTRLLPHAVKSFTTAGISGSLG